MEQKTIGTDSFKKEIAERKAPEKDPATSLLADIIKMTPQIKMALPKGMSEERFTRIAMTSLRKNEKLMKAAIGNKASFLAALMQSVQLGLEPNTPLGQAYLIPYGNEVQFQIGYLGLIDLAYRTNEYTYIGAHAVYEQDHFHFEYGLKMELEHVPSPDRSGDPIAYYAVLRLQNGGYMFHVAYKREIEEHAKKYSQAVQKGWTSPWKTDFISMAKKTVLKMALKYAPKSIEFSRIISADDTVKVDLSEDMLSAMPVDDIKLDAADE